MKIQLKKFGELLISRPDGREAFLAMRAYTIPRNFKGHIEIDFSNVAVMTPSWLDEVVQGLKDLKLKVIFLPSDNPTVIESLKAIGESSPVNQWRPCPAGHYWRNAHFQKSYRRSNGSIVRGHRVAAGCCINPSRKDQIYQEELQLIAKKFSNLDGPSLASQLRLGKNENSFNDLIKGWSTFWNDTLQLEDPLDPRLIKALIASESNFNVNPKNPRAKGLMQITETARKALGGFKDELKDHLIHIDKKDILDPVLNIAAGTRWLAHKKAFASKKLKRSATWIEAVAAYKDYLNDWQKSIRKGDNHLPPQIAKFEDLLNKLSK
jgi:hypothetical protein